MPADISDIQTDLSLPKRRNRKGLETRELLLKTTVSSLTDVGYANTSVEAVMSRAKVSRGSVLNQFPTRLDLMTAASDWAMHHMIAESRRKMMRFETPIEPLYGNFEVIWEEQNSKEAIALTEILLASRYDEALAEGFRPVAQAIEAEIDAYAADVARDAGVSDIAEYQLHSRVLILSLRGITIESMYDADREVMRRALEQLRAGHIRVCDCLLGG
jgi:AcrR family transcriptional regulator